MDCERCAGNDEWSPAWAVPSGSSEPTGRRTARGGGTLSGSGGRTAPRRPGRQREMAQAAAAEYDAFIERIEAPPAPTIETTPVETVQLAPGDVYALAGELWRWLLAEYAANPGPSEAFSKSAPNGPWGATYRFGQCGDDPY